VRDTLLAKEDIAQGDQPNTAHKIQLKELSGLQ